MYILLPGVYIYIYTLNNTYIYNYLKYIVYKIPGRNFQDVTKRKEEKEKVEKIKKKKRVRVKKQEKRVKKQLQMRKRKCHTLWYLPRKIRNTT